MDDNGTAFDGETGDQGTAAGDADDGGATREVEELRAELALRDTAHRLALERLRAALVASDPAVTAELVSGDSVEAIEASFAAARAMANRVRDELRREQAASIPAGSAQRSAAGPRTPLEKIRAGLAR